MLHTFGDIELRTLVRRERGSVYCSAETALAKSCIGMVLVWGEGDESSTRVLDKMPPPTVYNLLGLNTVLRPYLENVWDGNLNADLKSELGLVPPPTMGRMKIWKVISMQNSWTIRKNLRTGSWPRTTQPCSTVSSWPSRI